MYVLRDSRQDLQEFKRFFISFISLRHSILEKTNAMFLRRTFSRVLILPPTHHQQWQHYSLKHLILLLSAVKWVLFIRHFIYIKIDWNLTVTGGVWRLDDVSYYSQMPSYHFHVLYVFRIFHILISFQLNSFTFIPAVLIPFHAIFLSAPHCSFINVCDYPLVLWCT